MQNARVGTAVPQLAKYDFILASKMDFCKKSQRVHIQTVAPIKEEQNMLRATEKITALYCRLSAEDTKDEKKNGKEDPSNFIQHQQAMLM